jgi:CBS domain containing-hemolysin-like protein
MLGWLFGASLTAALLTAVGARALRQFSRTDLEEICRRKERRERFGEILRGHERVALAVEHLFCLAVSLTVVAGTTWLLTEPRALTPWPQLDLILTGVGLALAIAAAGIWVPWAAARLWAEPFLFRTWNLWLLTSRLATPFVWMAHLIDVLLHRLAGRTRDAPTEDSFEEEIRTIVTEGHREGLLEEDAREMIEGVIELRDADVVEIMTPRTDMHMLRADTSWEDMLSYVIQVGHTRIPVFRNNRDDIIGILYSKDLLPELAQPPGKPRRSFTEMLRKPYFVPETKKVDDLLEEFQQTRNHMAVVLDEYGGVSGLVTIEDVLEEIVGEIVDEYDEDLIDEIQRIDGQTCEALGRAHVDEINDAMGIDLPEDGDFDTIGGFVFSHLGHVPTPNESIIWRDAVRITVLEASRRRIDRVRLERLDARTSESA